jgi:hypothetical protein
VTLSTENAATPAGVELDLDALEKVALAVTPGDIDSAPEGGEYGRKEAGKWYQCPACDGQGEVEGATYSNFDSKPIGVQFFGIGAEFGEWEAYYRAFTPATVLRLLALARSPQQPAPASVGEVERLVERLDQVLALYEDGLSYDIATDDGAIVFDRADFTAARQALSLLEEGKGSSVAESGGTASPKSESLCQSEEGGDLPPGDTPWLRFRDAKPAYDGWGERHLLTWCTRVGTYDIGCINGEWAVGETIDGHPDDLWRWLDVNPERRLPAENNASSPAEGRAGTPATDAIK